MMLAIGMVAGAIFICAAMVTIEAAETRRIEEVVISGFIAALAVVVCILAGLSDRDYRHCAESSGEVEVLIEEQTICVPWEDAPKYMEVVE